jgi:hypothetical protein
MWPFPSLLSEVPRFCLHCLKIKGAVENFKTLSGSSPIFALTNHTIFSQATVPLRNHFALRIYNKHKH